MVNSDPKHLPRPLHAAGQVRNERRLHAQTHRPRAHERLRRGARARPAAIGCKASLHCNAGQRGFTRGFELVAGYPTRQLGTTGYD